MNIKNRTIFTGDNLDILRGMNSNCVDLIYLDPPFNSNRNYEAPIGSEAAGAAFKDTWTLSDVDVAWHGEIAENEPALYSIIDATGLSHGKGMKSYLIMMAMRLIELKRILKDTGSIYLHCDPTASHYLKMLMDTIFGESNFRNEIIWGYKSGGASKSSFAKKHDVILFYAKNMNNHIFNTQMYERVVDKSKGYDPRIEFKKNKKGESYRLNIMRDIWDDIGIISPNSKIERTGYPTQKPLKLLERIIKASSNEGDVVLDPFCGCATTCIASERLKRQWIGIDLSPLASKLIIQRAEKELGMFSIGMIERNDIPIRSDIGKLPPYKSHKRTLFGEQEGKCNLCKYTFPFANFTIDHIVPKSKGGQDNKENLQLLCNACNSIKGTGTNEEALAKIKKRDSSL